MKEKGFQIFAATCERRRIRRRIGPKRPPVDLCKAAEIVEHDIQIHARNVSRGIDLVDTIQVLRSRVSSSRRAPADVAAHRGATI